MSKNTVNLKSSALWIAQTGVMLALLVALQYVTSFIPKPAGQFVTGSCVNAVLAVTTLVAGLSSGITVAAISPWVAFAFGIAPKEPLISVAIMAGNIVFVVLLYLLRGNAVRSVLAWLAAAVCKFLVLYLMVVQLLGVVLKNPVAAKVSAMFSWPQLVTALIGGAVALAITPVLKKALKK